jgi:type II secretory pathway pseudopilin PulG
MNEVSKIIRFRRAVTLMELIIAMAMLTIIFAVVLPQFAVIRNSWDIKQSSAEMLQNGRVLIDHINRNLSKAKQIAAVSSSSIDFNDCNDVTWRYNIGASNYVQFGQPGSMSDLAGPVSSLVFTCYDACDLGTPVTNPADIRVVKVDATITNSALSARSMDFTTEVYLRSNYQSGSGWADEDIGSVAAAGSATVADCNRTVIGSGVDIWDYTDEFHYVYLSLSGDGQIVARVVDMTNTNEWAKAGVMIRETLTGGSKHAMMVVTPGNGTAFQRRTTTDGASTTSAGSSVTDPYWVKLTRRGNTLTGYESQDGAAWTLVGSDTITMATDVYIGLAVTSHNDGALCTANFDNVSFLTYEAFTEATVSTDDTSITIPTTGDAGAVSILGSWATGTSHTRENGTNRALVFIAHAERDNSITLNSVTYGGQAMTKVVERSVNSGGYYAYVVAYILDEAGVAAASNSTFTPTWSATSNAVFAYSSVFLQNVNQTTLTGANASNSTTSSNTITTSALTNSNGDIVIDAATCGNSGSYTLNNGFTEGADQTMGGTATGAAGHKSATGASETPSVTHSGSNRQVIIGFVVKCVGEVTGIEGDLLIAAIAADGDASSSLTPPPGEGWTLIDRSAYSSAVTLGAWWKIADSSESASHQFTWTGARQAYGWMMRFAGSDPTNPINISATNGQTGSTPSSPTVTTTVDGCLILRLGAFDDGYVTEGNPGLSGHSSITMNTSATSATVAFVAAGAIDSDNGAITPALPAGIATGDILLLFLETANQAISISNQNGGIWTEVTNSPQGTGTAGNAAATRLTVFWSRYNGTQGNPTTSDSGNHQLGRMIAIRGVVASGNPWDITSGGVEAAADTSGSIPGATTTVAYDFVVTAIATALPDAAGTTNFSAWTNGDLASVTEQTDDTTGQGNGGGLGIATGTKASAGAYGNTAVTLATASYKAMMTIALKPEGTVSGGAGYVKQSTAGSSGTSTFSLTASSEAQMLTIAIAPDSSKGEVCSEGELRP